MFPQGKCWPYLLSFTIVIVPEKSRISLAICLGAPKLIPRKTCQQPNLRKSHAKSISPLSSEKNARNKVLSKVMMMMMMMMMTIIVLGSYYTVGLYESVFVSIHIIQFVHVISFIQVIHSFIYWHIDWLVADDDSLMFVALAALRPTSLPTVIPTAGSTWWWEVNLWSFVTRIFFTDVLTKGCYNTPLEHTPSNL